MTRAILDPMSTQRRAERLVWQIAARLGNTADVIALTGAAANHIVGPTGTLESPWQPTQLSEGYPGLALLFAELAVVDPALRRVAHLHLSAAAQYAGGGLRGLYGGLTALGFAADAAACSVGGYQRLLGQLDAAIAGPAGDWADAVGERVRAGGSVGDFRGYDVISGLTGLGRHLLNRATGEGAGRKAAAALRKVLTALIQLATGYRVGTSDALPSWWVHHGLSGRSQSGGHLNLGLAHGVAGPLALLSLAWRDGVRITGQQDAIAALMAVLQEWGGVDAHGPFWPFTISRAQWRDRHRVAERPRDAWCYGSAGVARAVQLAGLALHRDDWIVLALRAAHGWLDAPSQIVDHSLCHGWAGLLRITQLMAIDGDDPRLAAACDGLAGRLIDGWQDSAPFGYRYDVVGGTMGPDRPGFLLGSAGIALALYAYATGAAPRTGWDAALLLT